MKKTRAALSSGAAAAAAPAGGGSVEGGGGAEGGTNPTTPTAAPTTSSSKFMGVTYCERDKRWDAMFSHTGNTTRLGCFDTEEGAARAYDRAMLWCKARGEKRRRGIELNFPGESDELDAELKDMTLDDLVEELRRRGGKKQKIINSSTTSKHRGVSYNKATQRWGAMFMHQGKTTRLGYFETEEDAARAYDCVLVWCKTHGVKIYRGIALNFPREGGKVDDELTGITLDELVLNLRKQGLEQTAARKAERGEGSTVGGDGGGGGGGSDGGGSGGDGGGGSMKRKKAPSSPGDGHGGGKRRQTVAPAAHKAAVVVVKEEAVEAAAVAVVVVKEEAAEAAAVAAAAPVVTAESAPPRYPSRATHHVRLKLEDHENGLVRCPRCGSGVSASERGCNVVTCRNHHAVTLGGTLVGCCAGWPWVP